MQAGAKRRHRRRPVAHRVNPWPGRFACAGMVLAVLALAAWRPSPPVAPSAPPDPAALCMVLGVVLAATFDAVAPPLGSTPEQAAAAMTVNDQLAQRRAAILNLDSVKELHCG